MKSGVWCDSKATIPKGVKVLLGVDYEDQVEYITFKNSREGSKMVSEK